MRFDHSSCNTTASEVWAELNAYSDEGWELVSGLNLGPGMHHDILLLFKRPQEPTVSKMETVQSEGDV